MKRNGGIFTFLTITLSSLVSAQSGPVEGLERLADGATEMIMIIIQFISDVLFGLESFDQFFFAKILLSLIIFFVVYTVLDKNNILDSNKNITKIIAASVTILSIRFLPVNFIEFILIQYSTFAIALTTFLPLMIFFFFVFQSGFGKMGRRIAWSIYGVILVSLYYSRGENLGEAQWIYYTAILAVLVFIIFDQLIDDQFANKSRKEIDKRRYLKQMVDTDRQLRKYQEQLVNTTDSRLKKELEKEIKRLEEFAKEVNKRSRK